MKAITKRKEKTGILFPERTIPKKKMQKRIGIKNFDNLDEMFE